MAKQTRFTFDGGAATYLGTAILGFLVTVCTLGICYPFALVLQQRWRCKHTLIDGQRLAFTGSAVGLFGHWIKWFLLSVITLGIYLFWVQPRVQKWVTENTEFAARTPPLNMFMPTSA
jgi:Predicted membrane protein